MKRVNLGLNIEAARRLAWFSQRELASLIKVSQVTLCQYERGGMNPPDWRLREISKACNVPLECILEMEWDRVEHRYRKRREYLRAGRYANQIGIILPPTR